MTTDFFFFFNRNGVPSVIKWWQHRAMWNTEGDRGVLSGDWHWAEEILGIRKPLSVSTVGWCCFLFLRELSPKNPTFANAYVFIPFNLLARIISWELWDHQESKGEKWKRKEKPVATTTWMQRLRSLVMWKAGEEEGMGSQPCFTVVCFLSMGLYELHKALLSAHCRSVTCLNIDLCNHCIVKHYYMCIYHNACSLSTRDGQAVISNFY